MHHRRPLHHCPTARLRSKQAAHGQSARRHKSAAHRNAGKSEAGRARKAPRFGSRRSAPNMRAKGHGGSSSPSSAPGPPRPHQRPALPSPAPPHPSRLQARRAPPGRRARRRPPQLRKPFYFQLTAAVLRRTVTQRSLRGSAPGRAPASPPCRRSPCLCPRCGGTLPYRRAPGSCACRTPGTFPPACAYRRALLAYGS